MPVRSKTKSTRKPRSKRKPAARKKHPIDVSREQFKESKMLAGQARAFELRCDGYNIREIAKELKVSHGTAHRWFLAGLEEQKKLTAEKANKLRVVELSRLDRMQRALAPAVSRGDPKAISAACRVSDQRCRITGLYAEQGSAIDLSGIISIQLVGKDGEVLSPPSPHNKLTGANQNGEAAGSEERSGNPDRKDSAES